MNIKVIPISEIQRAKYNPRKALKPGDPAYDRLKKAVYTFGLVEPLVWNERTGNLVGGHQRLSIIEERGDSSVEVSVVDLSEREEKTLNIALNKHAGEWDFASLADLLQELDTGEIDMEITGFGPDELEKLMLWTPDQVHGKTDPDEIPEPEEPIAKVGDLWILGRHRLLCGDATNVSDVARLLEGTAVDAVVTDPPYCSGASQEAGKARGSVGTPHAEMVAYDTLSSRGYMALMKSALTGMKSGIVYIFTDWRMWVNLFDAVESSGFGVRNMIVWDKQTPGMGLGWRTQHELIMCAIKVKSPFDFKNGQGTVIQCSRTGNVLHAVQKPVELLEKLIQVTDKAQTIADPFTGSGSTMIACETTGRAFLGMELLPHYVDVAVQRWEEFTGKKAELRR